jgi:hypothetical protein
MAAAVETVLSAPGGAAAAAASTHANGGTASGWRAQARSEGVRGL